MGPKFLFTMPFGHVKPLPLNASRKIKNPKSMSRQQHEQRRILLNFQATLVSESLKVGLEAEEELLEELEVGFRNGDTTKAFR